MKRYNKFLIVLFVLLFIGPLMGNGVKAEETGKNIIVLIDNSGSMNGNDSTRLALVAASMLVDTVDLNSTKLNIIAFGDKVTYVKKLSENPTVDDLKTEISSIKYDNGSTNMKDGLAEALSQLNEVNGSKNIIVLSDGKEEVPGETIEEHKTKLNELIETAQKMNVKINTIGLSNAADKDALSDIASKTLGNYFYAETAAGLFDIFSKALGDINGYYTISRFATSEKSDEVIKISSFVEEVIVNVLSSNQDFPLVNVTNDNDVDFQYKQGDRYKIYKLINDGTGTDNSIRISSGGEIDSSVIIQIKSKVDINVNTSSDSFEIPYKVPISIEASINVGEEINDLQLYQIDEGKKSLLTKADNVFKFDFEKDSPGYYPVFLIACDGNGSIISGKYFNITVTNNVPFSYTKTLPDFILTGNDGDIKLGQQDDTKVEDVAGDIYVWYEGSKDPVVFPLESEGKSLNTKINLKDAGKIKYAAQIRGIKEEGDEPFFYYLPAMNTEVIEKPYIKFECEMYEKPFKENEPVKLNLKITDNKLNKEETMLLLDANNREIKEFTVAPKESKVSIDLGGLKRGKNFSFLIQAKEPDFVRVSGMINTTIKVISPSGFFWNKYKVLIFIILILALLITGFIWLCLNQYYEHVESYTVRRDINVRFQDIKLEVGENITLYTTKEETSDIAYLNIKNNKVYLESEQDFKYSIGYFKLNIPEGNKILQGLNYLIKGEEIFWVSYFALSEQYIDGSPVGEIIYEKDKEIEAKAPGNISLTITFN